MACFLRCFGFPSKRRRRKLPTRILPGDQNIACYEPLESADKSSKAKERLDRKKIRKKVSFNLDVQTYEPIQVEETAVYHLLDSSHQEKEEDSANTSNYPSSYRYLNCRDSYDEEEEIADDESDLEFDGDSDADESQVTDDHLETKTRGSTDKPLVHVTQEAGGGTWPGCTNARSRGQYPTSVLNPVENTIQWKAMKASAARPSKHRRKENIEVGKQVLQPFGASPFSSVPQCKQIRPLLEDTAVNASLSNWLGSPSTRTTNSNSAKLPKKSMRDREIGIFQTSLDGLHLPAPVFIGLQQTIQIGSSEQGELVHVRAQ